MLWQPNIHQGLWIHPPSSYILNPWVGYGFLCLFTVIFKIFHGVELQVSTLRHPKTIWIYLGVSEVQIGDTVIQYTQFVPSEFGGFQWSNS